MENYKQIINTNEFKEIENLFRNDQFDQSYEKNLELLKANEGNPFLLNILGLTLIKKGKIENGINLLKQVCNNFPNMISAFNSLALAYRELGDYQKTLSIFNDCYKKNPNVKEVENNLAQSLLECGENEKSIKLFNQIK